MELREGCGEASIFLRNQITFLSSRRGWLKLRPLDEERVCKIPKR